jgi:hypothetical protein
MGLSSLYLFKGCQQSETHADLEQRSVAKFRRHLINGAGSLPTVPCIDRIPSIDRERSTIETIFGVEFHTAVICSSPFTALGSLQLAQGVPSNGHVR